MRAGVANGCAACYAGWAIYQGAVVAACRSVKHSGTGAFVKIVVGNKVGVECIAICYFLAHAVADLGLGK